MIPVSFRKQLRCLGNFLDNRGHFLDNDKANEKKCIDELCFALLLKAIENGMKKFTLKVFFLLFLLQFIQILDGKIRRHQSWQVEASLLIRRQKTKRRRLKNNLPIFINARR